MIRKSAMLTFALLLTAATSFGQVKLEHKFPSGKTFTTESIASIEQTLTIAGMGTETKVENITTAESTIGQRGTDGKLPVTEKIKALQITIGGTAGEYRFDSVNPNDVGGSPLEVMRDVHKALMKRVVTTVYGKDNRVEEIKTDSDALANLPEQVQAMAKSQLDPESQGSRESDAGHPAV